MTSIKTNFGLAGEKVAAKYLKNKGYKILDKNFQNNSGRRLGEIDLVVRDRQEKEVVFVEVKTREYEKFKNTLPEENITYSKLRKLDRIAQAYLKTRKKEGNNYRFDAISVWLDVKNRKAKVKHIKSL